MKTQMELREKKQRFLYFTSRNARRNNFDHCTWSKRLASYGSGRCGSVSFGGSAHYGAQGDDPNDALHFLALIDQCSAGYLRDGTLTFNIWPLKAAA
jgi:hypothetical protein